MASFDVLKQIVANGSDLTITHLIGHDMIKELAAVAKQSGARLTVPTSLGYELLLELSTTYGKSIGFIDGLWVFEKKQG